jgi:MHS family proline/betaine transporter-like MFS transporter
VVRLRIYGYLAPILGKLFFPASDPVASLLAAFGVFAIGFMARPVGGAIFGYIGDKLGRKPALTISVVAMGASTFAIGIMPTDAQIGASAALCLVLLRIIAGLSVGGEFTGPSSCWASTRRSLAAPTTPSGPRWVV